MSQGVQGCPSPGMAERGEGSSGTGNGGCNRSDGLPPVPRTPSQQGSGSGMDGQTMEIYTPVHMDCMCYVSGCNLHGGYNMMLSMVYLGRTLKLMQNGLRTTGIGYNTVKMRFMCM